MNMNYSKFKTVQNLKLLRILLHNIFFHRTFLFLRGRDSGKGRFALIKMIGKWLAINSKII